jgi:hypothetical protein
MPFKPASDWTDAFPEEPEKPKPQPVTQPKLPPARTRTRAAPAMPAPEPAKTAGPAPGPMVTTRPAPEADDPSPPAKLDEEPGDAGDAGRASYSVGYKKPPVHSRFRPGQSGNPKGRPKKAASLNTIVRANLTSKVAVRTASGEKRITRIEAVLHKAVEQAMKGNPKAIAELIKLYATAVPEAQSDETRGDRDEDLTATDLAMLAAYRAQLARQPEERP